MHVQPRVFSKFKEDKPNTADNVKVNVTNKVQAISKQHKLDRGKNQETGNNGDVVDY